MPRLPIAVTKPKRKRHGRYRGPKLDENLFQFILEFADEAKPRKKKKAKKKVTRVRHSYKKGRTNHVAKANKY